jgi:hypothetical protein
MAAPDLDNWLPEPRIRTRHRRAADVSPDDLWAAAQAIRIRDTRTLGRLVRWRIPGTPADMTYGELFRSRPFTVLAESDHCLISGLVGRIWTLDRDYPALDGPDAFRDWDKGGTAKVLFAHWVEDGTLHSEARVAPTDRRAGLRLRALWAVVGPFERLIGGEALQLAARRAQA